ncbi:hypothetical protein K1J08_11845 [Streptococcus sanguinis]|uniref:hypothetical protein n=1 Tax=Streptococcus sanguinis TaxID=1305 RepID=UPI001CC0BA3C|nr:hypothetical protein [Streptococcus sanguinis]MBZ2071939.1 hypothetical protein [Streptococcus sanguinis]
MATLSDDQKKNYIDQEIGKIINPYRRIIKDYALQRRVAAVEEFTVELFQQLENFINLRFQKSSLFLGKYRSQTHPIPNRLFSVAVETLPQYLNQLHGFTVEFLSIYSHLLRLSED